MTDRTLELALTRRGLIRVFGLAGAALPLAACGGNLNYLAGDTFGANIKIDPKRPYVPVDPAKAVAMTNAYRAKSGLQPVSLDGTLTSICSRYANAMAAVDKMSHALPPYGALDKRLKDGGYLYATGAENLGVGYRTLEDAFEGWRTSSGHDANLRKADVTQMGIASVFKPDTGWKTFWCMILARPRGTPSMTAGGGGPFGMRF